MVSVQLLLYGPSIVGVVIVAFLILLSKGSGFGGKLFIAPMLLLAVWLGVQLAAQISDNNAFELCMIRLSTIVSCLIALVYYFVIYRYINRRVPTLPAAIYIFITLLLGVNAMTDGVITSGHADVSGISIDGVTPLYYVLLVFTLYLFLLSLVRLLRYTRSLPRIERTKHYILFYSTLQIVVLSGFGSIVFPHVALAQVFIFLSALLFCIGIFFGIIRHRLFDVRLIVVRTLGYILSLMTLALVYLIFAYLISRFVLQTNFTNDVSFSPVNIAIALLLAFIFQPIKSFFDRITNSIFYRDRYNSEEFFALLSNVLGTTTDLKSLLERAAEVIAMTLKSEQAFFYIRTADKKYVVAGTKGHANLLMSEADHLDDYSERLNNRIIVTEEIAGQRGVYAMLSHRKISLLLPLFHGDGIIGYLALGEGLAGTYTKRDVRVLETIADELVIAIQNAQAVEEVREVNANLQQRIDGATRDLRSKNERLKQLDNTKDEFISLASHQLRTPLTSVKGYVSMILDGDAGPITEQQRRFLNEAFDSSTRMAGIIGDFLNVSRLQTGKFMLEKTQINLADIAEAEVEHLQNTAHMRGLKIRYKKPKHFPAVFADKSKIEQVMMNFMDNALFYAPNTKTVEVELTHDGGKAVFTVRDHGIGVPKSEQANLFTKFFRATNARKQRPDGTGVGIFLAKKVVTAHHGEIIFKSEEGEGSTFGFTLPLLK